MKFEEIQELDKRRYPVTMTFRCNHQERELVRTRAKATGCSLSTYLRKRATGGRVSQPIQDRADINELRQGLGLLKQLISLNKDVRPLLNNLEELIQKMSERIEA